MRNGEIGDDLRPGQEGRSDSSELPPEEESDIARLYDEDGFDLTRPDITLPGEYQRFRKRYTGEKAATLPTYDFWGTLRPDVLKRYRRQSLESSDPSSTRYPVIANFCWLHWYGVIGYRDGVDYEIRLIRTADGTSEQVMEALALAYIHAGPRGMRYAAEAAGPLLRDFPEPASGAAFPPGWAADPDAFRSGMNFDYPDATSEDLACLEAWYLRVHGEVPGHFRLLSEVRPRLLKAARYRLETAIRTSLPNQMVPLMMTQFEVLRGSQDGIREAILLSRGLKVTLRFVLDAVGRAMIYAGPASISLVERAAGDVLRNWDPTSSLASDG